MEEGREPEELREPLRGREKRALQRENFLLIPKGGAGEEANARIRALLRTEWEAKLVAAMAAYAYCALDGYKSGLLASISHCVDSGQTGLDMVQTQNPTTNI